MEYPNPMAELEKILYVEDEPDIQAVAQLALELVGGFRVKLCPDGLQALQAVAEFSPDLILLDVMMPGLSGPQTLERLRANGVMTPVVFMTAKVRSDEVQEFLSLGALGVIAKPFDPMQLADEVRRFWEHHHHG